MPSNELRPVRKGNLEKQTESPETESDQYRLFLEILVIEPQQKSESLRKNWFLIYNLEQNLNLEHQKQGGKAVWSGVISLTASLRLDWNPWAFSLHEDPHAEDDSSLNNPESRSD